MNIDLIDILSKVGSFFVPFLFALCFHEYAHAWMAFKKGDNTAKLMGRLSMNPFVHMDIVGTFLLPFVALVTGAPLFGWAKPVPVNIRNLKTPKKDIFWIALAGPLSNVLLAFMGVFILVLSSLLALDGSTAKAVRDIFHMFVLINLFLAFFNMIPLHPLDGGKILARFLPDRWNEILEDNQLILNVLLILIVFGGGMTYLSVPIIWSYKWLIDSVAALLGLVL